MTQCSNDGAGGGIYSAPNTKINIYNAQVTRNALATYSNGSADGAGIAMDGTGSADTSVLTLYGGEISYNCGATGGSEKAADGGGIIGRVGTTVNMYGGYIRGNWTGGFGGAMLLYSNSKLVMTGGSISGNWAAFGGGINMTVSSSVDVSGGDNLEPYDHGYTIGRFRPSNDDGSEYGLTVYGIEDNPRLRLPYPYSYDSGKVPVVRSDGTGYELQSGVARMYRHHIYILDEDRYLELISTSTIGVKNFSELKDEEIVIVKVITDMGQTPVFPVVAYRILSEDQQVEIYYINSGTYDMLSFSFDMAVEDSVVPL